MRPAWLRFLCAGVIAYPALCTEYPRFRKIGDTAYRRERERERELSRPEAMVARCPEAALWNRWSPFMTAARVRVPNWRNVRSLALHRHGQSHVAEPFTVRSLNPELNADPLAGAPFCRTHEDANENARGRDAATCHLTNEAVRDLIHPSHREACSDWSLTVLTRRFLGISRGPSPNASQAGDTPSALASASSTSTPV